MPTGVYPHKPLSAIHKNAIVKKLIGRPCSKITREKIGRANSIKLKAYYKEHSVSIETRELMSKLRKGRNGSNWKGGASKLNHIIRSSIEFRLWRESVFARDNWTCQKYKIKGGFLHPHHIKNFAEYPELRFAIDNGITFSKKAHDEFHKKYGRKNNTLEQVIEFLNN